MYFDTHNLVLGAFCAWALLVQSSQKINIFLVFFWELMYVGTPKSRRIVRMGAFGA